MTRPVSSAAPPTFDAPERPRGRRGTAALTIAILASALTVALGLLVTAVLGILLGPSSSMRQTLEATTLLVAELVVGAPALIAGLVAHFITQELEAGDEGAGRGRVAWQMAFAVAMGVPLCSALAIWLLHAFG